jgi:hypothetical protein
VRRLLAPLLLVCACSASPAPPTPAPPTPPPAPPAASRTKEIEDQVALDGDAVVRHTPAGEVAWRVRVRLFPSPDPSWRREAGRRVAVGAGGTVLAGASDGSLVGLDADGRALYQLGVRGAVSAVEARSDGGFDVRTSAGLAIVVGPGGAVGQEVPIVAAPGPTTAYRARRAGMDGKPFHDVRSVVAAAPDDVWALVGGERAPGHDRPPGRLFHWNGTRFERRDSPLPAPDAAWGSGRDDVWFAGASGVARFDGARWWRIVEIEGDPEGSRGALSVTGSGRGDVWVFGKAGLWHVTPEPHAEPDLEGTAPPPPPAAAPSLALPVAAAADPSYRLERVVLEVDGGRPLHAALAVAEGPGGVVWLHDGARLVEHDGARTRVLYEAPRPEPWTCWSAPEPDYETAVACVDRKAEPLGCQRCAAPTAAGEGAVLAEDGLHAITSGRASGDRTALPALNAVAASPSGALWAVSARADDGLPHAAILGPRGPRLVAGLPPAAYADVAARADDDVWMAGGLTSGEDGERAWPEGEGTLVHFDGRAFLRHRGPDGALLSVAATGPGEAWAVGLDGGVLHAKAGAATAFHLEREGGGRLRGILRAVAARGPDEVWMVGDGSTVLRWDGTALRRVDASAAGSGAALSSVLAPGAKPGWVVGPSGIWRIVPAKVSSGPAAP